MPFITLNKQKKTLKLIITLIPDKGNFIKLENREWQFYNFIVGTIDTKPYETNKQKEKSTPVDLDTTDCDKKALEAIWLS